MLYHLSEFLLPHYSGFRVFAYLTLRGILAALTALLIALLVGPAMIRSLAARQIGLNEIDSAIQNWNVNIPTGTLFGSHTAYNVLTNGQLRRAAEYGPVIVAYHNGAPVRLDEVARVLDSVEDDKQTAQMFGGEFGKQGTRVVQLAVNRQPGSNTLEVIDKIRALHRQQL